MSKDNDNLNHDKTQEIIQQYQNTMKNLIKEKGLNHQSLEKHLSDVMNQLSNEVRKMTGDLLKGVNEEKKTVPAPAVEKKPGSTPQKRKSNC